MRHCHCNIFSDASEVKQTGINSLLEIKHRDLGQVLSNWATTLFFWCTHKESIHLCMQICVCVQVCNLLVTWIGSLFYFYVHASLQCAIMKKKTVNMQLLVYMFLSMCVSAGPPIIGILPRSQYTIGCLNTAITASLTVMLLVYLAMKH